MDPAAGRDTCGQVVDPKPYDKKNPLALQKEALLWGQSAKFLGSRTSILGPRCVFFFFFFFLEEGNKEKKLTTLNTNV